MESGHFIDQLGVWLGRGTLSISAVAEVLGLAVRWTVESASEGQIYALQEIEMKGEGTPLQNRYRFFDMTPESFRIELENEFVGKVLGTGVIDKKRFAWEFRDSGSGFEGVEVYEKQSDNTYRFCANFLSQDQLKTSVEGVMWLSATVELGEDE